MPADDLPLPTLLSQLLTAFTIEFDNEFEHRSRHTTTSGGAGSAGRGPWLVSQPMWANFMQFIPEAGLPLREVSDLTHLINLAGLERWRYVAVGPDPADGRPAPPRRDWIVKPTRGGRRAQQVWEPLAGMIEDRWCARFSAGAITAMRDALQAVLTQFGGGLPRYLPVVAHQMFADLAGFRERPVVGSPTDLSVLLSQVLLAFTLDFERESAISLPVGANLLRVLTDRGVRVRDLPDLTGVSKEAFSMAAGVLARASCAVTEPDPLASRGSSSASPPRACRRRAASSGCWAPPSSGGGSGSAPARSARSAGRCCRSSTSATTACRGSPRDCGPTPMAGGRETLTCGTPPTCSPTPAAPCPTTRWCCTAADGPMAAEHSVCPTIGPGGAPQTVIDYVPYPEQFYLEIHGLINGHVKREHREEEED